MVAFFTNIILLFTLLISCTASPTHAVFPLPAIPKFAHSHSKRVDIILPPTTSKEGFDTIALEKTSSWDTYYEGLKDVNFPPTRAGGIPPEDLAHLRNIWENGGKASLNNLPNYSPGPNPLGVKYPPPTKDVKGKADSEIGVGSGEDSAAIETTPNTIGQSYREYHPLPSSDPLSKMYGPTKYILREIKRHGFLSPKLAAKLLETGWQVDKDAVDLAMRHGIVFNDFIAAKGIISAIASSSPLLYGEKPEFMELRDLARMPEVMKAIGFDEGFSLMNQAVKSIAAKSVGTTVRALEEVTAEADTPQNDSQVGKGDKKAGKSKAKDGKKKGKETKEELAKDKNKGDKVPKNDLQGIEYLLPEKTKKEWIRDQLTKWINSEKKGRKPMEEETDKEIDIKKTAKLVGDEGFKLYGGVGALVKSSLTVAQVIGMVGPTAAKAALAPEIVEGTAALLAATAAKAAAAELLRETTKETTTLALSVTFAAIGKTAIAVSALGSTAGGILWGILSHKKKKEARVYYKHMKETGIEGKMMGVHQIKTLTKDVSILTTITEITGRMQITVTRTESGPPPTSTTASNALVASGTTAAQTSLDLNIKPAITKTSEGPKNTMAPSSMKSSKSKHSKTVGHAQTLSSTITVSSRTVGVAIQTGSSGSTQSGGDRSKLRVHPKVSFGKDSTGNSTSGQRISSTERTHHNASGTASYNSMTVNSNPTNSLETGWMNHDIASTILHPLSTSRPENHPSLVPAQGLKFDRPGKNQTSNSTATKHEIVMPSMTTSPIISTTGQAKDGKYRRPVQSINATSIEMPTNQTVPVFNPVFNHKAPLRVPNNSTGSRLGSWNATNVSIPRPASTLSFQIPSGTSSSESKNTTTALMGNPTTNVTATVASKVTGVYQLNQTASELNTTTLRPLIRIEPASAGNESMELDYLVPSWNRTRLRRHALALRPVLLPPCDS